MEILKLLEQYKFVRDYEIIDYKTWQLGYYLKVRINLYDNSILSVREYISEDERNYSYHWQDAKDALIIRWDNSPHHKHLKTHPHHIHIKDEITESTEISLEDVLKHIDSIITRT